jgi:hypothetical protein
MRLGADKGEAGNHRRGPGISGRGIGDYDLLFSFHLQNAGF